MNYKFQLDDCFPCWFQEDTRAASLEGEKVSKTDCTHDCLRKLTLRDKTIGDVFSNLEIFPPGVGGIQNSLHYYVSGAKSLCV